MSDAYYMIRKAGSGLFKEKMSRFLSFSHTVSSQEEAREVIKKYENEYHDSRHVCWAYMLHPDRSEWQLSDNGEPSGTAGKPILGQIQSFGLTNVVVIVVRYFGGIKLGTSGLISAYREAARLALEDSDKVECHEMGALRVTFPYVAADGVMKIVKKYSLNVIEQTFDNTCGLLLEVRKDHFDEIKGRLDSLDAVMTEEE